ncbi:MAG: hypothetical protein JEY91_10390, partial [Spirochaetaceae bacterium]|nr:hypothetical protein [Spirochaetaceae bacterium]
MTGFRDKKIHLIQLSFLSLFIVITGLSIEPIIRKTEWRMEAIKSELIGALEKSINYEISYDSISPSIFSYISIKNLVIYKDKQKDIKLASIQSFKAFYSPFYFFTKEAGRNPLQAVRKFNISNASFYINQQREEPLFSLFSSPTEEDSAISLLPLTTVFTGKNISVLLETDSGSIRADNLFISLTPVNHLYKTRIDGDLNLDFIFPGIDLKNLTSTVSVKGTLTEYFESLNFTLKTSGLSTNIFDLEDQTFQLLFNPDELQLRKVQDNSPIDLAMRYDRNLKDLIVTFQSEAFEPSSLVSLKDSLIAFAPYSASKISGNGTLLYNLENGGLFYSLKSDIQINRDIFNRDIFVKTDLTGDLSQINIRSINMRTREGQALFTGNILTENYFPSGILTFKNVKTPNGYVINSAVNVGREGDFLYFTTDSISLGATSIDRFDLVVYPEKGFISASLRAGLIDPDGDRGELVADSFLDFSDEPQLSTYINLNHLTMDQLITFLPGNIAGLPFPEEIRNTFIDSEISLTSDFKEINGQINQFQLMSAHDPENLLTFSANYSETGFKINDLFLNWGDYNFNGYINSGKKGEEYIITTYFDLQDKPYRLQAIYNNQQLLIEGDYGVYGFIQNEADMYTFKMASKEIPIPLWGYSLYGDLDVTGNISDSQWNVFFNDTRLKADELFSISSPEIRFTAEVNAEGCNFYNIQYSDITSSLKGLGRLTYASGDISSWISLLDEKGRTNEQYDLFFTMEDGVIESRASILSSPLDRFGESGLTGLISADMVYTGTTENPDFDVVFHTDNVNFNGVPIELSSFIRGDKDVIRVSELELNYRGIMLNRGLVLLEMNQGKLLAT